MALAPSYELSFLNANDVDAIVELRRIANQNSFESRVDLDRLEWNRSDRGAVHLGIKVRATGELAACVRLSFYTTRSSLDATTLIPYPATLPVPVALLSRAATKPSFENQGLHSILRCRALETCLKTETSVVLGSFETSAKRSSSLESLGYRVLSRQENWDERSYMKSSGPVVLVGLTDQNHIQLAAAKLRSKYGLEPLTQLPPLFVWI